MSKLDAIAARAAAMSNARLQQGVTSALVLGGGGWAAFHLAVGQWAWAAWALVVPVFHAAVLGLELVWAAVAARSPASRRPLGEPEAVPQPHPPASAWVKAWLQEIGASALTFGWRQPWAYARHRDHLPATARGRTGVLLVHGYLCNRGFWNPWLTRLEQADVPYVAVSLEPPFGRIQAQAQCLHEAWEQLMQATGKPPLLVGHSLGGVVIRQWLSTQTDAVALEHQVVTIGSPHHGTLLASFSRSKLGAQLQLMSPCLQQLAASESPERRARMTCYWSVCDNVVFPANTATLPGARNVAVWGRAHVALAHDPLILQDVQQRAVAGSAPL